MVFLESAKFISYKNYIRNNSFLNVTYGLPKTKFQLLSKVFLNLLPTQIYYLNSKELASNAIPID